MSPHAMMALAGAGVLVAYVWLAFPRSPKSAFRVREVDRMGAPPLAPGQERRALHTPSGPAHEILGIRTTASKREILGAHRKLMKRYHPDRIAAPGTPEWEAAQELAARINLAKEEMLARLKR